MLERNLLERIYSSFERALKNSRVKWVVFWWFFWFHIIMHDYLHYFCIVPKKVLLLKYRKFWVSHLKNRCHYSTVVENTKIKLSISPYCTLLFSRKENFKFFEVPWLAVLCTGAVGCIVNVWGYQHWSTTNTTVDIYLFFKNGHKSTQTRCKVCPNVTKCTTTIDFCLTNVFFINLGHLSHPTLVLLFKFWKGKGWLKLHREHFVKKNTVMLTYTQPYTGDLAMTVFFR